MIKYTLTKEVNPNWSNYDKVVANNHLTNYGTIILDEYDCPIDNEYDIDEIVKQIR